MNFKLKNNNKKIGKTPCEQTIFSTMYLRVYAQLLGIYPEETKIEKDTCTPMFIAALLQQLGHGSNLDVHWQMNG